MSLERHEIPGPNNAQSSLHLPNALREKLNYQMLFLRGTRDNHKNYDDSRRTRYEKEGEQARLENKYRWTQEVIAEASSQDPDLDPDVDTGSDFLYCYTPPEDPEVLERINKKEIGLFEGARIPRRLPDSLEQHALLLGGNLNGQGPSQ